MTGMDMLLKQLIKLLKLEPEVERGKVYFKQVEDMIEKAGGIQRLGGIVDEWNDMQARIKRIEVRTGVNAGSRPGILDLELTAEGTASQHANSGGH